MLFAHLKDYAFVLTSLQPWDKPLGSNIRDIAYELARTNRVLFVNQSADVASVIREKKQVQKQTEPITQVQPNLWVLRPQSTALSINWLPDGKVHDWFNYQNNRRFANEIKSAIKQLGFNKIILLNDSNMFRAFYLKELLRPELSVYYTRDNMLAVDFWKKHGLRLEPALMRQSDVVLGNSTYLTTLAKKHNPNAFYVGQGCELDEFDAAKSYPIPPDLAAIPYPRIGYTGALTALRLDLNLLEYVARQHPAWQLVLVGPEDEVFRNSTLHQFPNVHFLGAKKPQELSAYMSHLEVLINPQKVNEVTIGNYPRKIDEYLAMGKAVVAVRTEAMEIFRTQVLLANDYPQFAHYLEKALKGDTPSNGFDRINFAKKHSWENSVNKIKEAVSDILMAKAIQQQKPSL